MPNRDITIAELPATTVADDNSYIPIDNGDITCKIKVSDYNAGANATARAYAEAAGTSANSASASAGSAATYASNASQSAQNASNSADTALNHANNASSYANNAYEYAAAASTSASNATSQAQQVSDYAREAGERSEDAEAFALGQRKGVDVDSEDVTYQNNARFYAEQAANSKSSSETAASSSLTSARMAEGYANGKQNGSAVPSSSEYYHNNAEYFSGLASDSANDASLAADRAESAVVKTPYIGNNNHWYVYDFSQEQYVDTGVKATGDAGAPGQQGDPGVDGITPTINAAASVDNTSGTPSVTVTKAGTNTNPFFTFNFSGLKGQPGEGGGASYDDTEIKSEINDIWKVQGELGAKNLIPFPYPNFRGGTKSGVTFTVNDDGSVTLNGTATATIYNLLCTIDFGEYTFSSKFNNSNAQYRITLLNGTSNVYCNYNPNDHYTTLVVANGTTVDNLTVYPMLRYKSDTDDTWRPYAATNKELTDKQNELAAIAGEYLQTSYNSGLKKKTYPIGATSCKFYYGDFVDKYGVTSTSDLDFALSSETASGNVVAYNNVSVDNNDKVVTFKFDELTEDTTFACKCSKIQ